ncbi:MAG TPA: ribosome-associated translation inhibitor RaiA [Candidatus Deferrimicrobiaceae bacterium]|nr:ribosome-associated translation inhibitor RaiA [Candidatus Deferrimicrobiaceae bacterium]
MRTIVKGKNYEVSERDRAYAVRKLGRLERILDDRTDATVELSVEQHRSVDDSHIVDVTLLIDGRTLRGKAAAPTHRAGIDQVLDKIERRAVDFRQKPRARTRPAAVSMAGPAPRRRAPATAEADEKPQVVKVKRFHIEPMFEEDAVARMEELGHAFFVFVNAENERVAILYRRRAGDYGLIEPMVGGGYTQGGPPGRSGSR